ncbi:MAG: leucyl/phenylalanyl-tRNA--protein transferase [Cytophagales bacterium]|nr:MAG: leucyl/phenylalanyl-tRNA--protein transferase [Cytophagales bacterium]
MSYTILGKKLYFPPVSAADSHGIVAIGGDLDTERLLLAYHSGIFPWFSEGEPILWWSPNPRFVLYPSALRVSSSMKQLLKRNAFEVRTDSCFREVIGHCQQIYRPGQGGTWITEEMLESYCELHGLGKAHSVEVFQEGVLVGGLYGVALGGIFFGESMFSRVSNASKYGFILLVENLLASGFELVDCQVHTNHLESLGAVHIKRDLFMGHLASFLTKTTSMEWGKPLFNGYL